MKFNLARLLVLVVVVSGCSSSEMKLDIPQNLNPQAKQIASDAWPKIQKACPGINKYSSDLRIEGVEDNLDYNKVTIKIKLPDGSSSIPADYAALGHNCFLDIAKDGKSVSIAKNACKAVFMDKKIEGTTDDTGNDFVINLK